MKKLIKTLAALSLVAALGAVAMSLTACPSGTSGEGEGEGEGEGAAQ